MSKGDYVLVKSEIGGKLEKDEIRVTQNGGVIELEWDKKLPLVHVRLLNRVGSPTKTYTFAVSAVRSLEQKISDE